MFHPSKFTSPSTVFSAARVFGGAVMLAPLIARGDGPPAPPPAAYDACDAKGEGDACSVAMRDHTVDGTCNKRGADTRLSCRPNHPPHIPREAVEACNGKNVADTCTVSHDGHTIEGACENGPEGSLHCRPSCPPPG